jgi:hypothetical protein
MNKKKEMQLHVNYRAYGEHLNTVYMDFKEVEILKIQSFQQFLNNMFELGVIVPVEIS